MWLYRDGSAYEGEAPKILADDRACFTRPKKCTRCGGAGGADKWKPTGWTCFQCNGACYIGTETVKLYTADKLAKLDATRDKRREKARIERERVRNERIADEQAAFGTWLETDLGKNAALMIDAVKAWGDDWQAGARPDLPDFVISITDRFDRRRELTENQVDALAGYVIKRREKERMVAEIDYAGEIGDTVEVEGEVDLVFSTQSKFGTFRIYKITGENAVLIYKGSACLYSGSRAVVRGKVKELDSYKGLRQTVIGRPRIVRTVREAEYVA